MAQQTESRIEKDVKDDAVPACLFMAESDLHECTRAWEQMVCTAPAKPGSEPAVQGGVRSWALGVQSQREDGGDMFEQFEQTASSCPRVRVCGRSSRFTRSPGIKPDGAAKPRGAFCDYCDACSWGFVMHALMPSCCRMLQAKVYRKSLLTSASSMDRCAVSTVQNMYAVCNSEKSGPGSSARH